MLKKQYFITLASLFLITSAGAQTGSSFKEWALTPPMGWNSWDCYGPTVVESSGQCRLCGQTT